MNKKLLSEPDSVHQQQQGAPATHKLGLLCLSLTPIHLSQCFYLFTFDFFFFSAVAFSTLVPMVSIHFCPFSSLVSISDFFFFSYNSFLSLEAIFSQSTFVWLWLSVLFKIFIWLPWVLRAVWGIFDVHCSTPGYQLQHVGLGVSISNSCCSSIASQYL